MTTEAAVQRSLVAIVLALGVVFGVGEAVGSDCPPVSREKYRALPEESDVALTALAYHLQKHAPERDPLCVTMPGYKAVPIHFAKRLATPSLRLDSDPNCRFQDGRRVVGAEGVWQSKDGHYVADVRILEFHDISRSLGVFRYMVTRRAEAFSVQSEVVCQQ